MSSLAMQRISGVRKLASNLYQKGNTQHLLKKQ